MKIKFCSGTETVTGANYLITYKNKKILVDCGLIQKENVCELENFEDFLYNPQEVNLLLITHAHLDHIGRIPLLFKRGFRGKIFSTLPTREIAKEILLDSCKVLNERCRDWNVGVEEIYNELVIEKIFDSWEEINYYEEINIDGIKFKFYDAGHILGSAFIEIEGEEKKIIFSGDLGNKDPLLNDTDSLPQVDFLVLESTYGDKVHEELKNRKELLEDIIEETLKEKRTLIIPAFALERTQEILYDIISLIEDKKIPEIKIFLDSPLALRLFRIYEKYTDYLNERTREFFLFKHLENSDYFDVIYEENETQRIYNYPLPKIIISSSGMLQGGRIINILKKFIDKEETTILFVGFQPEGSLGRKLLEGEKYIEIEGEKFYIEAKIEKILSYSGHKDQKGILEWVNPQRQNIKKIFLVQGEENAKIVLRSKLEDYLGIKTLIPTKNQEIEL